MRKLSHGERGAGRGKLPNTTNLAHGKASKGPLELIIRNWLCDLRQISGDACPYCQTEGAGTDDYGVLSRDENIKIL